MKNLLEGFVAQMPTAYIVSSAHPRVVDGKPSKNPRYLQKRPDLENPRETYLAEIAARLEREIPADRPVHFPVNAVLAGRRNSPPDPEIGLPSLAVYNPIHYQELPELFMEFISSLTGKSPSTTGFGSEGALTKAPFNALWPVVDLNNALLSAILTGYAGFTTSAGYVGPKVRVDHDISMLVPEIWCRMRVHERDPHFMISEGLLERVEDFEFGGRTVLASRLGYRITTLVCRPLSRPFVRNARRSVHRGNAAAGKAGPGTIRRRRGCHRGSAAPRGAELFRGRQRRGGVPSLKALLHIMAQGGYEGMGLDDPSFRELFDREAVLQSDWYQERLRVKQERDMALWRRHVAALEKFRQAGDRVAQSSTLKNGPAKRRAQLARVSSGAYLNELRGTIGADPFRGQITR